EGEEEDPLRFHPALEEVRDAIDQRSRLARSGAGDNEHRHGALQCGRCLLGIELGRQLVERVLLVGRRRITFARPVDPRPLRHGYGIARSAAAVVRSLRAEAISAPATLRGARSKSRAAAAATRSPTSPSDGRSSGSSAWSDVMRTDWMPHGTMRSKKRRSVATLSAKPCQVTQSRACTPIDAILRSSIQTPVYGGFRSQRN